MADTTLERQKRFHELLKKRDAIFAESHPIREERDRAAEAAREVAAKYNDRINEIEKDLYTICEELGFLARGLGGKTGDPLDF